MTPQLILSFILGYFVLLIAISWVTSRKASDADFYVGGKRSPWFVVAFGMIGASLSGVTFISVPGAVVSDGMSYMQVVLGYLLGYIVIANVLMPLYYRLNLTSIYSYLEQRFGFWSYKTGAFFFLISRIIGSSFRLYLVAIVLDKFVFAPWGVPFIVTVAVTIALIWLYSFRGGIKTIVWTDTLQTLFMLTAMVLAIFLIGKEMNWGVAEMAEQIRDSKYSKIFVWDGAAGNNFFKHFLSGVFITIVMTGLDQDMMQKNLSCKNIKEAKKNMYWMSSSLILVNFLFLALGVLLYLYAHSLGVITENFDAKGALDASCNLSLLNPQTGLVECVRKDNLFPFLAINYLPPAVGVIFVLGLIAAAYSSADSALTALTTSFCIDFLGLDKKTETKKTRYIVHLGFSVIILLTIVVFKEINDDSVINSVFKAAGYTYGPLLGLFAFGLFTKHSMKDNVSILAVCIAAPVLTYIINANSVEWLYGYKFGFEILILNGALTFAGLLMLPKQGK